MGKKKSGGENEDRESPDMKDKRNNMVEKEGMK